MVFRELAISSSFVKNSIKIRNEEGSGEAKLYIGSKKDKSILEFFNDFNNENKYIMYKVDILDYFKRIYLEFIGEKCNNYNKVGISEYTKLEAYLSDLDENIEFKIEKFEDGNRIYIRPISEDKWVFDNVIRSIALPKITNLKITKNESKFIFSLTINVNEVIKRNTESYEKLSTEEEFRLWLSKQITKSGKQASKSMVRSNSAALKKIKVNKIITEYASIESIFEITNLNIYKDLKNKIQSLPNYNEMNQTDIRFLESSLNWYEKFLNEKFYDNHDVSSCLNLNSPYARNRILFGAPGTGKSHRLKEDLCRNKENEKLEKGMYEGLLVGCENNYERVTFHPDYSYANFVGTYKPIPARDEFGKDVITYKYVPGPFMRSYVKALKSKLSANPKPIVIIIEEINRANVAAVFGDIFQLLDRKSDNTSEYPIQASEDIKKYLADELGGEPDDYQEIKLPENLFIWATMNSADQGVFPMDTAFKRRWDFTYLGIDENEEGIEKFEVILGKENNQRKVNWNKLRKAINKKLSDFKINEDKLIGPYFISKNVLEDSDKFIKTFKNKVIMYLFDDAAKHKRSLLFENVTDSNIYSEVCNNFEDRGVFIFSSDISNHFKNDIVKIEQDKDSTENNLVIVNEGD
jgi:type II restriction-modification system restriction subunit|nr:MAG TPA: AAA domain protein [Caudoviricetes sp.]